MTKIFSKALFAASAFILVSGAAEARGFLEQAVIDAGNGIKAVGSIVAPPSSPAPNIPSKPAPGPMSPCTSAPGACGTAPKG